MVFKMAILTFSIDRPWAVGKNYFISWHSFERRLVCGLFERHVGTLLPNKGSQAKNLPDTEKMTDYGLILNCIAAKTCEIFK